MTLSMYGIGAFPVISRYAMLEAGLTVEHGDLVLPRKKVSYAELSRTIWAQSMNSRKVSGGGSGFGQLLVLLPRAAQNCCTLRRLQLNVVQLLLCVLHHTWLAAHCHVTLLCPSATGCHRRRAHALTIMTHQTMTIGVRGSNTNSSQNTSCFCARC